MIKLDNIRVSYDGVCVLDGISLTIERGEIVALVGDNGCGKSTLGRVMCAAQLVDEGGVSVDGHDPSVSELERMRVRELVGRVQQDPFDQIVSSLVFDEVAFGPRNLGLDEDEVARRVEDALRSVGLDGFERRITTELSGGEQQRLALAGVLAMRPRYLVLDEPTAQLDPASRNLMRELFVRLAHKADLGVVLITHDTDELALCDRVIDLEAKTKGAIPARSHSAEGEVECPAPIGPDAPSVIDLHDVAFAYGEHQVLRGVDAVVHAGEVVMLTGHSGAGKSTLATIIAGLHEPSGGAALINGAPARPGCAGLAFQNPEAQFFLDTVHDEIAFAPRNLGLDDDAVEVRVREAASQVGLAVDLLERYPFELSGGQARRVALASVLALDAPAYVLDEPSAALDASGRAFAHRLVRELAAAGKAVIVITHDVDEWRPFVHRELALRGGVLVDPGLQTLNIGLQAQKARGAQAASPKSHSKPLTPFCGYVAGSALAGVDARVKIVLLLASCAGVFAAGSPVALLPWCIALAACLAAANMDVRQVLRGLRPVGIVLAFTLLANLVSCDGNADVVLAGAIGLSTGGGMRGVMAVLRIVLLVGLSLTVAVSTTGTQISDAAVRLLRPLARLGLPVAPLGMVLSLALRFIPLVSEELQRIRLSQQARGARFDEGPLSHRIQVWASVLIPLLIGLFRRADRLAEAMAARCYGTVASGRPPIPHPLAPRDKLLLVVGLLLCVLLVALGG